MVMEGMRSSVPAGRKIGDPDKTAHSKLRTHPLEADQYCAELKPLGASWMT